MLVIDLLLSFLPFSSPVTFESRESKTIREEPVYNRISLATTGETDIWKMRQSHHGIAYPQSQWDELMIKVDRKVRPYQVSFHQLKQGKEIEFSVSCYFCHSNGPRAIRPRFDSEQAPLDLKDKMTLRLWNMKIKSYGKMVTKDKIPQLDRKPRKVPLMYLGKKDTETLKVASCTLCHHDGWWGRGQLTRQQALPITHLLSHKEMPPWPFTLSQEEREQIERFVKGF